MKKLLVSISFLAVFFTYHNACAIIPMVLVGQPEMTCKNASTQFSHPFNHSFFKMVEVTMLSSEINKLTSYEHPLYVSEINSGLIYITELKNEDNVTVSQEFFFSKYDSITASWEQPINIETEYSKFCEVNKVMNFEEIFITIDNDIYSVDLRNKTFSPLKLNINTKYAESSPVLSPDGSTLYFISDRKGGYGGNDIWASEKSSNGKWIEPYNLGKEINTTENEETPFVMLDGATLYFSSKGHYSCGGYDIFVSTLNDDGVWSSPENLGAPVNSTSDDYYYIANSYGSAAYYSSDKLDKDNQDIFIVKYDPLNQ